MLKSVINGLFVIIKRFIFSILTIYTFNMITISIGIIIPMNFFTIIVVMLCGFSAVIGFSLFSLLIL